MSVNVVCLTGNLTRKPNLRMTQSGMPVLSFGIAVNDRVKEGDTWKDRPSFIDCTMFGNRAQSLSSILTKGMKVAIEGKLRWSQWEQDGQKRSKIEVIPETVDIMSQKQQNGSCGYGTPARIVDASSTVYDDDIPF